MWLPLARSLLGTWLATEACALTGNCTGDPLLRRPILSPLSHTGQGRNVSFLRMCHLSLLDSLLSSSPLPWRCHSSRPFFELRDEEYKSAALKFSSRTAPWFHGRLSGMDPVCVLYPFSAAWPLFPSPSPPYVLPSWHLIILHLFPGGVLV